jgi:hypothetical protein
MTRTIAVLALSALLVVVAGGIAHAESASDDVLAQDTTAPSDTTPATDAPDGTDAPDSGEGEDDGEESGGFSFGLGLVVVIALLVVAVLLFSLMSRSREPAAPAAAPRATWRDHLRAGYAEARWLSDVMVDDLAIWRGNTLAGVEPSASGTALSDQWGQLAGRIGRATDMLYRAEAEAPDATTATLIGTTARHLAGVRSALDARAEARRTAVAHSGDPTAAEREQLAANRLSEARGELNGTLTALAGLL